MSNPVFREVETMFRHHAHPDGYDQPETPHQEEPAMALALIASIEKDLSAAGHEVSDVLHKVLTRHLTVGNVLAHAGQWAASAEASPIVQAVERYALGGAGEQMVATWVEDVAGFLNAQDAPAAAPNMQAGAEPAPAQ